MLGAATDHLLEMRRPERERVFNLGYYTWVEQQGTALADFDRRRDQAFWDSLLDLVPVWDGLIENFNHGRVTAPAPGNSARGCRIDALALHCGVQRSFHRKTGGKA